MPKRKTHQEFTYDLKEVIPTISVIGEYSNCRTKVLVQCGKCGYQWLARPSDLLRGHGCPRCSKKERKTTLRFYEEVASANPNIEVLGEYINTSTKVEARCKTCGYSWLANPSTLLHGNGCPACGGTRLKTQDEFIRELAVVNPDVELLSAYKNNRSIVIQQIISSDRFDESFEISVKLQKRFNFVMMIIAIIAMLAAIAGPIATIWVSK